jgi:hypothetical protein
VTEREYYIINKNDLIHHVSSAKNILDSLRMIEYSKGLNVVWTKPIDDLEKIIQIIKSKSIVKGAAK